MNKDIPRIGFGDQIFNLGKSGNHNKRKAKTVNILESQQQIIVSFLLIIIGCEEAFLNCDH